MPTSTDFALDQALLRRRFAASAPQAAQGDFLAREVSSRMAERLDYIRLTPSRILDLGCGHGADLPMLAQRYPEASCIGLDFALPRLDLARPQRGLLQRLFGKSTGPQLICADAQHLPLARASTQLVWSNLLLSWLSDPLPAIKECHRVLEVGGLLMFATLGPDTLRELRGALDSDKGERVHRFIDMHDLGDCLVQAGFADPVMDMQRLTLTYPDADAIFRDLRAAGATNAATNRPRGLAGKAGWQAARAALEQTRQDGRLPLTLELVFGHAWKAAPKQIEDGRAVIQFHR
ncbi:methyltransferase domain-containing protein [Uliginosibacterium aquaticum]|uniref:Malonyl-[acyl-carrier protein] O-methyltransferase n=1 Tax=Uliginosibacterium aquaticum TaxID=2731212 RepID=A0ABX2IKC0_9RHOO|nr:methyltransferase domain-containing protein [Uliginosibacterium aquaticum]NSL54490.1 methyltransferase domain-containing protein [Uliginosibacterium aquaticum]